MSDRMTFWLAVISVALQVSVSRAGPYPKSEEVAPYEVIHKAEKYEIRSYHPSTWVCYDYRGAVFSKRDQAMAFFELYEYINGENAAGVNITQTAPTTVRTMVSTDNPDQTLYQMCLYIPKLHQENPPQPLESGVFILHRNKLTVAARQFNHYMMEENEWEVQMEKLKNDLKAAGEPNMNFDDFYGHFNHYMLEENEWEVQMEILKNDLKAAGEPNMDFDDFYGAAFDPPFDMNGRPNEVWVVKKD